MAKKFNFKLESVLKFRADKVNQAIDSLNQAVKFRLEKEREIKKTLEEKNGIAGNNQFKVKAGDLQAKISHINHLNDELIKLEDEKKQIIEIENLRRIKLTNAMKEEKVIEKLKEKQLNNYMDDVKKEESKFLDELGINAIGKQKDSGF